MDDIEFWVGSGANKAAMVIDWVDTSATDKSLVWGFRWDGTATGRDMYLAIVGADERLYTKIGSLSALGTPLYGWGYDADADGAFEISSGTPFNQNGIAVSGAPDNGVPAATAFGSDLYAEGWYTGFWNYAISAPTQGSPFEDGLWLPDGSGPSTRNLLDGDWDSWTYTPTFDFDAIAQNPVAAELPFTSTADFDADGDIDGSDFLAWQTGFGTATDASLAQGDSDGDGDVDAEDFQTWATQYGTIISNEDLQSSTHAVPEPSTFLLLINGCIFLIYAARPLKIQL